MRSSRFTNKPDHRYLRTIYKGLTTASEAQRIQILSQALQWYDKAIEYVIHENKVSPTRHRELTKAILAREAGIDNKLGDREAYFRGAIRHLERFCEKLRPTHVDKFYKVLTLKRKKLEHKQHRVSARFEWVTQMLNNALGKTGLTLKVIDNAQKPRMYDGNKEFVYSREQADKVRKTIRKDGLLAAIVEELPHLTRAMATTATKAGGFVHDPKKQNEAYVLVLNNFVAFCSTDEAPKRLVKQHFDEMGPDLDSGAQSQAPKKKLAPRRKANGERYASGSCIAHVFKRLSDGKPHTKASLSMGAPSSIEGPLQRLTKHGKKYGEWRIEIDGEKVTMAKESQ